MQKLEFRSNDEELQFYRTILDKIPAIMGIQQMDDLSDPTTNHNIWVNQNMLDFLKYSCQEMDELGFRLFLQTIHPDDMEMIGNAVMKFGTDQGMTYGGVYRLKPKNEDYKWVIGAITVMETRNGIPWRFLNISLNIDQMKDTQEQVIVLTKEINHLKNYIKVNSLTRREKQIVKLITEGMTDREIGKHLYISHRTAKTHRNNIHRKLSTNSSASIIHFALDNGLS
jgi:DNA-binding CsgD family transcriptional regulator